MKPDYGWFIQNWRDSAHVQLLGSQELAEFVGQVTRKAAEVGRDDHDTLIGHCLYRALYEQDQWGSMGAIINDISDPSLVWTQTVGPIRTASRCLRDDNSPFLGLGISGFWLLGKVLDGVLTRDIESGDRAAHGLLAFAQQSGASYIRWFGSHDWAGGVDTRERLNEDYWKAAEDTILILHEHGLLSAITLATRRKLLVNPGFEDAIEYVERWAKIIAKHPDKVCLVEIANEGEHPDNGWEAEELRELILVFQDAISSSSPTPVAVTAPLGETWQDQEPALMHLYSGAHATVGTIHFPRKETASEGPWRWVRQPYHVHTGVAGVPEMLVDNEHQKWRSSHGGQIVEVAAAAPIVAWVCGCAMSCHHDQEGVFPDPDGWSGPEYDALRHVFKTVVPQLPVDLPNWHTVRAGRTGHPFPMVEAYHWTFSGHPDGVSRAYAATRHHQYVMVLTGIRGECPLEDVQAVPYRVVSLLTGNTVYHGHGPYTCRQELGRAQVVISD